MGGVGQLGCAVFGSWGDDRTHGAFWMLERCGINIGVG